MPTSVSKTEISHRAEPRYFTQYELITKANGTENTDWLLSFFQGGNKILNPSGVCAGLVIVWFEFQKQGRDLLDELNRESVDPLLLKRIQRMQLNHSAATFTVLKKSPTKKIALQQNDDEDCAVSTLMPTLGVTSAIETPCMTREAALKYFDTLKKPEIGMHQISIMNTASKTAHTCAFMKKDEGYIFFDPNNGERTFDNITLLKNYFLYNHVLNMFSDHPRDDEIAFLFTDYDVPELEHHSAPTASASS